jgi:hypothetical protein
MMSFFVPKGGFWRSQEEFIATPTGYQERYPKEDCGMIAEVILTVAESKRLIAKAVARLPSVQRAMEEGLVFVGRGTTNAYVLEELLGHPIDKIQFTAGLTLPVKGDRPPALAAQRIPDQVFRRGKLLESASREQAWSEMGPGDVFIKGGNALDYKNRMVGILIGHPTGGTMGALGTIIARRIELVLPIGLEKLVYSDLNELSRLSRQRETGREMPTLMPVTGTIVTEIEALQTLCNIQAVLYSAGGIAGAEGSVRLLLEGDRENLEAALRLVDSVQGEGAFIPSAR